MRLFISLLISVIILNLVLPSYQIVQATPHIHVSADQAVLMEQQSGRVIYDKNGHEKRPVASITKVMTALLAIEYGQLQDEIIVSERATTVGGSSIYLEKNERMTLEDLLYGLMLRSGNDASVAIAEHIAGSVEGFAFLMNEKALYLGMTNTNFMNPHGLDEDGHYSSAYDIAILMRHAMENDIFQSISSTKSYHSTNRDYKWFNKNKLLTHLYEYSTGGKTGFTKKAGRTLVSTAEKDDITLIAVTLHAPNDWNDHISLYETYFEQLENKLIEKSGKRNFVIDEEIVKGTIEQPVILALADDEIPFVKKRTMINPSIKDSKIGSIEIQLHDEVILTVPVYNREKSLPHFIQEIKELFLKVTGFDMHG